MTATTPATVRPEHLDGARMRDLQGSARICARVNGHKIGRFTRQQTGRRTLKMTAATCSACNGRAECYVGAFGTPDHMNQYGGPVVLFRCPARPENRCQELDLYGRTAELRDDNGASITAAVACDRPYSTVWRVWTGPDGAPADAGASEASGEAGPGLKLCFDHARRYRALAAPGRTWRQVSGPTDY